MKPIVRHYQIGYAVTALLLLAACGSLTGTDIDATMAAGDGVLNTEAAVINRTAIVERTSVSATVEANSTTVANIQRVNQQLGETLVAGSTATPTLSVGQVPEPPEDRERAIGADRAGGDPASGAPGAIEEVNPTAVPNTTDISDSRFQSTGVTDQVDDAGCPVNARDTLPASASQLYVTFTANDLPAGTTLRAEWRFDGATRVQDTWTTPEAFDGACLWFVIDSSSTPFTPGQWQVQVFAGRDPVISPVTFTIAN